MQVGLATTVITPEWPICLAGYAARTEPSEGQYADLEASAVVFDSQGTRVGIVALDLIGVDASLLAPIRAKATELGIPPERLLVNCSHTHCGPEVRKQRGACRAFDDAYHAALLERVQRLLDDAVDDLRPARLEHGAGACTLGINRRRVPEGETAAAFMPDPNKPIDPDVPVLRVLAPSGATRAVLFSYAAHPTTMGGLLIGPDYPGAARAYLREKLPGAIPVFLQGCGGDVKPRQVNPQTRQFAAGTVEVVREIGHELGRAVTAALCGTLTPLGDSLNGASVTAELPTAGNPSLEELDRRARGNPWERAWAEAVCALRDSGGALADAIPIEVQALELGGLHLLAMSSEVCTGIGLEIKRALPEMARWTLGYSNDLGPYIASRGEHAFGGYEVTESFIYTTTPAPHPLGLHPASVDILVNTSVQLARGLSAPVG